jgi:ubiquinone/menaquinone biosynthesis C-methylase UbiE
MSEADYFLELQTRTGWGRVLARLRDWINPQAGWLTLDVGCGPGLMPALLAQRGCRALGVDFDPEMFRPDPLHPQVALADALRIPFPDETFDLVTASNLLFLLPQPEQALREMARLLRPGGQVVTLNPTEKLTLAAAEALANERGLTGFARDSLLNWASRAETHFHWTEAETTNLFAATGLELLETHVTMSPGFARFARGRRLQIGVQ